jgi:hypothetical protein
VDRPQAVEGCLPDIDRLRSREDHSTGFFFVGARRLLNRM